jgi:hypothetical protein
MQLMNVSFQWMLILALFCYLSVTRRWKIETKELVLQDLLPETKRSGKAPHKVAIDALKAKHLQLANVPSRKLRDLVWSQYRQDKQRLQSMAEATLMKSGMYVNAQSSWSLMSRVYISPISNSLL